MGQATSTDRSGLVSDATGITPRGREMWNGADILRHLDQLDGTARPGSNEMDRCAASATLATAIISGPAATDRFVLQLYRANEGREETRAELSDIYGRLGRGSATYGDMHRLQEITYRTYNTDGANGLTPSEVAPMRRDLSRGVTPGTICREGSVTTPNGVGETPARTRERLDALRPGESFMLNVDGGDVRHAVAMGRDRDGRNYVYDSAGAPNFFYEGERPELFNTYLDGSRGNGTMNLVVGDVTQRDW